MKKGNGKDNKIILLTEPIIEEEENVNIGTVRVFLFKDKDEKISSAVEVIKDNLPDVGEKIPVGDYYWDFEMILKNAKKVEVRRKEDE